MKRAISIILLLAVTVLASGQTKKVSVLGDSYSTFQDWNPEGQAPFYPNDRNDVTDPSQTWWNLYIKAMNYQLEVNDSWGGTTICNTGYGGMDVTKTSFLSRIGTLGNPDIIFVFGGTNDAWAHSPIGEYKYSDWTKEDLKCLRPALACLLTILPQQYPDAKIYTILNSELQEEVNESFRVICNHYGIQLIELYDIEKQNGHPSIKGMQSICEQLLASIVPAQDGEIRVVESAQIPEPSIRIVSTTGGEPEVVYVLDGRVISSEEFKTIKPDDIESIEIIKETANEIRKKYTDKDGVGVILITTRKEF